MKIWVIEVISSGDPVICAYTSEKRAYGEAASIAKDNLDKFILKYSTSTTVAPYYKTFMDKYLCEDYKEALSCYDLFMKNTLSDVQQVFVHLTSVVGAKESIEEVVCWCGKKNYVNENTCWNCGSKVVT